MLKKFLASIFCSFAIIAGGLTTDMPTANAAPYQDIHGNYYMAYKDCTIDLGTICNIEKGGLRVNAELYDDYASEPFRFFFRPHNGQWEYRTQSTRKKSRNICDDWTPVSTSRLANDILYVIMH